MLIVLGALVDEAILLDVSRSIGCGHGKITRASFFHMNHVIVKQEIRKSTCIWDISKCPCTALINMCATRYPLNRFNRRQSVMRKYR